MEILKHTFKVGDRVSPFASGSFRYGVIVHLKPRIHIEPDSSKKFSFVATIDWFDTCNKLADSGIGWTHKLKLYEPRRHPLTTIFRELPKKERIISNKRQKRIDRRRNK